MQDFFLHMVFSTIEGLSVYAISLYTFRYNLKKYLWPVLLVVTLFNLISFGLGFEPEFTDLSPIVGIILTVLFLAISVKIPIIWALIVGAGGYFAFGLLQVSIVLLSGGYLSINEVQTVSYKGYLLQTLTGFIGIYIPYLAYKFGYGFSFEFRPLAKKWETVLIVALILGSIVWLAFLLYVKHAPVIFLLFFVVLVLFLYYSIRKEREED